MTDMCERSELLFEPTLINTASESDSRRNEAHKTFGSSLSPLGGSASFLLRHARCARIRPLCLAISPSLVSCLLALCFLRNESSSDTLYDTAVVRNLPAVTDSSAHHNPKKL